MPSDPTHLNEQYAVDGLRFEHGKGGRTVARVRTEQAEAEIYLHGAHVTHYQPSGGRPVLFLSEKAAFDGASPIRGGIPICFPWFSNNGPSDDSPSHGFARIREWSVADARREGEDVVLIFVLVSNESTRDLWPNDFVFTYTVRVGRSLRIAASVTNVGDDPCRYELALHTYMSVTNVADVTLDGFAGEKYVDQLQGNQVFTQQGEPTIDGEVDRIYQNHTRDVTVTDGERKLVVSKTGGDSTVLWNPHITKAERMGDFGDEEWPHMLCVESAAIGENAIKLAAGQSHALEVTLSAS